MQQKHVKLSDKLAEEIKRIHNNRVNRCRRKQTMSDTLRLLLYIGVNQYNSESGQKYTREAERQKRKEEQQELEQQEQDYNDEEPKRNSFIKLI